MTSPLGYTCTHDGVEYRVPDHTAHALLRYVVEYRAPGRFLHAVLVHDLFEAFAQADSENLYNMVAIVSWLYNEAPGLCHGSDERVVAWLSRG